MRVAVYGTLRKGAFNNRIVSSCRHLGRSTVKGYLFDYGPFPYFLRQFHGCTPMDVAVDIYEVDRDMLKILDKFEGYVPGDLSQSLYRRTLVRPKDYQMPCMVYEWNRSIDPHDHHPLILSGDWFKK